MPAKVHPDQALDPNPVTAARFAAAKTVTDLKQKVLQLERRLPFTKTTDDQLLDLAADAESDPRSTA